MRTLVSAVVLAATSIALTTGTSSVVGAAPTLPDLPACTGDYTLSLGAPLEAPGGASTTVGFTMSTTAGTCAPGSPPPHAFSGTLTGHCGAASGSGSLPNDHTFTVAWSGPSLTMTGEAVGAFALHPLFDCTATTVGTTGAMASVPRADACAGAGLLILSPPVTYASTTTASFALGLTFGSCAVKTTFTATGTLTGGCAAATGSGITSNGATFQLDWAGAHIVTTGNVVGAITVTPDAVSGQSCLTGALYFLANVLALVLR